MAPWWQLIQIWRFDELENSQIWRRTPWRRSTHKTVDPAGALESQPAAMPAARGVVGVVLGGVVGRTSYPSPVILCQLGNWLSSLRIDAASDCHVEPTLFGWAEDDDLVCARGRLASPGVCNVCQGCCAISSGSPAPLFILGGPIYVKVKSKTDQLLLYKADRYTVAKARWVSQTPTTVMSSVSGMMIFWILKGTHQRIEWLWWCGLPAIYLPIFWTTAMCRTLAGRKWELRDVESLRGNGSESKIWMPWVFVANVWSNLFLGSKVIVLFRFEACYATAWFCGMPSERIDPF